MAGRREAGSTRWHRGRSGERYRSMCPQLRKEAHEAFECLYGEAAAVDLKWRILNRVYSKSNLQLLCEVDKVFFFCCQVSLTRDILMSLCRLTDPETQGPYHNMTLLHLDRLTKKAGLRGSGGLTRKLHLLKEHPALKKLRKVRNQRDGHWDRDVALGQLHTAKPLTGLGPRELRAAVGLVGDTINKAAKILGRASRRLGPSSGYPDAGENLIKVLRD